MTYLTVPISASDLEQAMEQVRAAKAGGAEILELRVDYLDALSVSLVEQLVKAVKRSMRSRKLGIIVTCRDKDYGGAKEWPDHLRVDVLIAALKSGAEYVDFEYEKFHVTEIHERLKVALSNNTRSKLILSSHSFDGKFEDIGKQYRRMSMAYPAAIPKLVYKANHINDIFEGLDLLDRLRGERIIFSMAEAGLSSRIIAKKLGSFVTFASIDEEKATAAGQLTSKDFKKFYNYDSIDRETKLYGILGSPVGHSLSPVAHNVCFAKAGLNKAYVPLLLEGGRLEFEQFMNSVMNREWLGFRGFSVTIPHKRNALNYVLSKSGFVEPLAERIGAVNTLIVRQDKIKGYNTDYCGALDAITSGMRIDRSGLKGLKVSVVGAGGVSRAIVAGLSDMGAKIKIYNRTVSKAKRLAGEFKCEWKTLEELKGIDCKLLINCTSLGMHPDTDVSPVPKKVLKKGMVVFDTVYNPQETLFLSQAKEAGAKTIGGINMFINQAMLQFKLFTGKNGDAKLMRRKVKSYLSAV